MITIAPKNPPPRTSNPVGPEFAVLYVQYRSLIRSVLYRMCGPAELDDLVQDTFVRVWKGLANFRQEAHLKTWMYRIAVHVALDHQRAQRRAPTLTLLPTDLVDTHASAATIVADRDTVVKGLDRLSFEHRTVLVLHCMEELALQDIADMLDVPLGTIKSRLFHAKRQLLLHFSAIGVTV